MVYIYIYCNRKIAFGEMCVDVDGYFDMTTHCWEQNFNNYIKNRDPVHIG